MTTILSIKNMVCPRCIAAVERTLTDMGYAPANVTLGKAVIASGISADAKCAIGEALAAQGFELLDDASAITVDEIKRQILAWTRMEGERQTLSAFLQEKISREYSVLSKLFSDTQGVTIERFAIAARIEYAKELLSYGQMTAAEIAYRLGYSSAAHLSTQFKKETGMSPSQFRSNSHGLTRKCIDSI